jgi:NurA-like 5'-3' nuclease
MAKIKQHELRAYVKPVDYKKIEQEAAARGLSLSRTVRNCLMEYISLKEELASSMTNVGVLGDEQTGKIIHTLLARTEERVAATIQKMEERISGLSDQMLVMTAMIDRMYMGIMQHLPELPVELNEAAVASSKRRHQKWVKATEKLIISGELPAITEME